MPISLIYMSWPIAAARWTNVTKVSELFIENIREWGIKNFSLPRLWLPITFTILKGYNVAIPYHGNVAINIGIVMKRIIIDITWVNKDCFIANKALAI